MTENPIIQAGVGGPEAPPVFIRIIFFLFLSKMLNIWSAWGERAILQVEMTRHGHFRTPKMQIMRSSPFCSELYKC